MKDNKIDIMCQKIGEMTTMLNAKEPNLEMIKAGLLQLQYDLELLRKCSIDNPDFDWKTVKGFEPDKYYDRQA